MKRNYNNNNNNNKKHNKKRKNKLDTRRLRQLQPYTFDFYAYSILKEGQNLYYNMFEGIRTTQFYSYQDSYFQEFKILFFEVLITPHKTNGAFPPVGYAIFLANEQLGVGYSQIPFVQGNMKISPEGTTSLKFFSTGRNTDINRWYNTGSEEPEIAIYFRFEQALGTVAELHYSMQVRARILFRRPKTINNNKSIPKEEVININEVNGKETQGGTNSNNDLVISDVYLND
jgi:hypothetical protein